MITFATDEQNNFQIRAERQRRADDEVPSWTMLISILEEEELSTS